MSEPASETAETVTPRVASRPLVVNITAMPSRGGRWFEPFFPDFRWEFFDPTPRNWLEWRIKKPSLAATRASWTAARTAIRQRAKLLISHDPKVSYRIAEVLRLSRTRVPHLAWAFNFAQLPAGSKHRMMSRAFQSIDRFIVHSTMERQLYSDYFGVPIERFELMRWAVGPPEVNQPDRAIEPGDYICALGSNARDYTTLMAAMARLPEVRLVAVLHPNNLEGLTVPPNVTIRSAIPQGDANNILKHSRFMVLPLVGTQIPCGHITIVAAMHLGVASVVTGSTGLGDYAEDGVTALTYQALSAEDLAAKIQRLWDDPTLRRTLAESGQRFAAEHCSEQLARDTLAAQLERFTGPIAR